MISRCKVRGVNRLPKTMILLSNPAATLDRRCNIESIPRDVPLGLALDAGKQLHQLTENAAYSNHGGSLASVI
jgi:hypothetical protein